MKATAPCSYPPPSRESRLAAPVLLHFRADTGEEEVREYLDLSVDADPLLDAAALLGKEPVDVFTGDSGGGAGCGDACGAGGGRLHQHAG
jgi:hypothetical protein